MLSWDPVFAPSGKTKEILEDMFLLSNPSFLDKQTETMLRQKYSKENNANTKRTDNRTPSESDKNRDT